MIEWIALAVAADADNTAHDAQDTAKDAEARSALTKSNDFVLVKMWALDYVEVPREGFWNRLFGRSDLKPKLSDNPVHEAALKMSDILSLSGFMDHKGTEYARVMVSKFAQLYGPVWEDGERYWGKVTKFYVKGNLSSVTAQIAKIQ